MARMVTGRTKIFSCYRSYHGATLGASNASGDWRRYAAEIGGANGFVHFMNPQMYRDGYTKGVDDAEVTKKYLDALDLQLRYEGPGNVAAILMESIVGANGVILPPDGYMEGVRALCDKYGILLICDEVMAGFYRTGKMFAFMNFDMKPDIITFAKGVTCGYVQLGGCIVSKKVAEYFEENVLQCGLTYSGHTLACAAGVAAMKYYKEHDIEGHVAEMHEIVAPFMDEMVKKHKCIGEARCIGLFGALEVVKNKETREPMQEYGVPGPVMPWIFAELKKRGFATFGRENFIEICPPLIITKEELEAAGFVVTAEYDDESDKDENTVLSVSPNEGEKAKKGSVVTVTVSSGKGAQKDVYYDIPLPGGVSDDLTMKIYVDGTLIETRTVNPSTSPYSNMTFTGKGRANLVITLNDQQYITAEIDYTTQSINVTSQQSYATPEPEPTPTPDNDDDMSESDGSVTAHED